MDPFTSVFLGIVQGLTEFIPVSSSGHLVIAQKLIPGFSQPGVVFDVILHMGTLFSVLIYFRKKLFSLFHDFHYLMILIVGTIPAVIVGLFFKDFLEQTYKYGGIVLGIQFLVTSAFCYLTDKKTGIRSNITIRDSAIIGLAQAFAILPAVSRSGATIFSGVARGIKKFDAAEFSFLLSVPAVLGAGLLELFSYRNVIFPLPASYVFGFMASLAAGMLSIYLTIKLLRQKMFKIFALYTLILGVLVMFL